MRHMTGLASIVWNSCWQGPTGRRKVGDFLTSRLVCSSMAIEGKRHSFSIIQATSMLVYKLGHKLEIYDRYHKLVDHVYSWLGKKKRHQLAIFVQCLPYILSNLRSPRTRSSPQRDRQPAASAHNASIRRNHSATSQFPIRTNLLYTRHLRSP